VSEGTGSDGPLPDGSGPGGAGPWEVPMRWRDIDGLGHVNNAVVLTLLEEGRDHFLEEIGTERSEYVVGKCSITFRREITLSSAPLRFRCEVSEVGRSSFRTREELLDNSGEVAVEAEFGLVMWDGETSGSRPITGPERVALERALAGKKEEGR
jgi:acyl-CoA thioester hydrolase